jgi:hypothetical protein
MKIIKTLETIDEVFEELSSSKSNLVIPDFKDCAIYIDDDLVTIDGVGLRDLLEKLLGDTNIKFQIKNKGSKDIY